MLLELLLLCTVAQAIGAPAELVLMKDGVSKGAVCLDGSPPGYYLRKGFDDGADKLIMFMEGGGVCEDEDNCVSRSKSPLGSSKNWPPTKVINGFLSDDRQVNPLFYNWNVVYLMYCDGASFAGNVDNVVVWKGTDLYFRGFRILNLAVESAKSMGNFSEVILTGGSAGGVAVYLHADHVGSFFPEAKYRALADAGFMLDAKTVKGVYYLRGVTKYVFNMQNCAGGLDQDCVKDLSPKNESWKCFSAQYNTQYIKSKIFALNSQVDTWQLKNDLQLGCLPPQCSPEQLKLLEDYGKEFVDAASTFTAQPDHGYFLDSCLTHVQLLNNRWTSVKINGQLPNETFANWYFERSGSGREIDCAYPCNNSCN